MRISVYCMWESKAEIKVDFVNRNPPVNTPDTNTFQIKSCPLLYGNSANEIMNGTSQVWSWRAYDRRFCIG